MKLTAWEKDYKFGSKLWKKKKIVILKSNFKFNTRISVVYTQ